MTVLDTSAVVDFLLGLDSADEVAALLADGPGAAPDLVVFEVLAVLRREVARGNLDPARATAAVDDLGDLDLVLFPSMALRTRAWSVRENLTVADALFVALAEALDEPLATKDAPLARAAADVARVGVVLLGQSPPSLVRD